LAGTISFFHSGWFHFGLFSVPAPLFTQVSSGVFLCARLAKKGDGRKKHEEHENQNQESNSVFATFRAFRGQSPPRLSRC
jgi:hypothetical protein